jgi:hypothetical protein
MCDHIETAVPPSRPRERGEHRGLRGRERQNAHFRRRQNLHRLRQKPRNGFQDDRNRLEVRGAERIESVDDASVGEDAPSLLTKGDLVHLAGRPDG